MGYNDKVKAKSLDDSASSQSSGELELPGAMPMGPRSVSRHSMTFEDIGFLQSFKKNHPRRMNWELCLKAGHRGNFLMRHCHGKRPKSIGGHQKLFPRFSSMISAYSKIIKN
ncbi:uncharacterized protein BYT42DRAFT_568516 [Radiomyces spectabilis]|uniref:uncharacterized protein n=1 Tax=Radiomyces spectabilis TaxID=64574 RepID=UPI00221E5472|nr:uncharacterized protein BYT42DRAFT_568516 [Radiomyces spectabilis]KAI8379363.1 hypothetical protein BYT42DRAFT_568516 [Radiomyces spectabilis]